MPGPARAGILLYALDVERLADFYTAIAGMARLHASDGHIILESADIQLLVHRLTPEQAAGMVVTAPPQRRDVAVKFFLTVPSMAAAREAAQARGGDVFHDNYPGPGFLLCNAMDPEGNVFQLREFTPA